LNHHIDKGFYPLGVVHDEAHPKINDEICVAAGLRTRRIRSPRTM
jgi:hypothetical protein